MGRFFETSCEMFHYCIITCFLRNDIVIVFQYNSHENTVHFSLTETLGEGKSGVGKMLNFNWLIGVHDMFKLKRLSPNFKDQGRFKGGFLQSSRNVLVYITQ